MATMTSNSEIDMWGTARKMREVYGAFAAITAIRRARQAQVKGDTVLSERWSRIARIISAPMMAEPAE